MAGSPPVPTVGGSPPRPDGRAKVTGAELFTDDILIPGIWYGATVRCPLPSARIEAIDASEALEDTDVIVVTARDLPGPNAIKLITDDWPVLADGRVDHAFQAVALVAAPTRERARRAAGRVRVDATPLPAVLSLADAMFSADPRILSSCVIDHGDPARAFGEAEIIVEGIYETGHQEHAYIEPNGMIAIPHADGSVEVIGSMQCPFYVHKALVHLLGEPAERVRVRQAATGGGFGGKEDYPDLIAAHAVLLARRAGRPVKIIYDRHEDLIATTKRHPSRVHHRTAVGRDGKLSAMEIDVVLDGGAYVTLSPVVLSRACLHAAGPYHCANVRIRGRVIATNTPPNGAFRGFGAPQTQFAMERQMDRIARALRIDPLTLRERNAYRTGDATPTGQVLSESVTALECLKEAERRTDFRRRWLEIEADRASGRPDDGKPRRGIGLSLYWHGAGFTGSGESLMRSPASLRLAPDGVIEVLVSSCDFGQGTAIALPQIVAESVGVPLDRIRFVQPDTAVVPDSGPTVASRTIMIVGGVLAKAGADMAEMLCTFVAGRNGEPASNVQLRTGRFVRPDGAEIALFPEIAEAYVRENGSLVVTRRFEPASDQSFDDKTYRGTAYSAYGWGCDICEVSVDPDTLDVRPERITVVCDVGKAIHPVLCRGQIEGGTLQSIGYGYLEEVRMRDGRLLNDRMATCLIPTSLDAPETDVVLLENPAPAGPFGAKGVGELPLDGGAPAIVAAIENATGIAVSRIPATPETLFDALSNPDAVERPRS